ncbi:MAG: hypothetical protein WC209_10110 [Ignavibacteriaceae bacterium]|jgi:hypothetical protein
MEKKPLTEGTIRGAVKGNTATPNKPNLKPINPPPPPKPKSNEDNTKK